jgi:hypothetical protein
VNVRAKWGAVNSVFLVQLRKMLGTDFYGLTRVKELVEMCCLAAWWAWFGLRESIGVGICAGMAADCSQGLHRKCRKAGRWSGVSGAFRLASLGGTAEAAVST